MFAWPVVASAEIELAELALSNNSSQRQPDGAGNSLSLIVSGVAFVQTVDSSHEIDAILRDATIHPSNLCLPGRVRRLEVVGVIEWQSLHDHGQFPEGGSVGESANTVFECWPPLPARSLSTDRQILPKR